MTSVTFLQYVTLMGLIIVHHSHITPVIKNHLASSRGNIISKDMIPIVLEYEVCSRVGSLAFGILTTTASSTPPPIPVLSPFVLSLGFIGLQVGIAAGAYSSLAALEQIYSKEKEQSNT